MIGRRGERGLGISVLAPRHDDDDDVRKVIHWELYKKVTFDHTTQGFMHKVESFVEKMYKILRNSEIKNRLPNFDSKTWPSAN